MSEPARKPLPVPALTEEEQQTSLPPESTAKPAGRSRRWLLIIGFVGVAGLAGGGWKAYDYFFASRYVSTDNAYVAAYSGTVTPQIAGVIKEILPRNGQFVKRGEVLVLIDDADFRIGLDSAEASLDLARNRVRQYKASLASAVAKVASTGAEIARNEALVSSAEIALDRARSEYARRQKTILTGAVSEETLANAKSASDSAEASLEAARAALLQAKAAKTAAEGDRAAAQAAAGPDDIEKNAEVAAAAAAVETARLNLGRTTIRAPMDGIVTNRQVSIGTQVSVGAELLKIVPIEDAYVEANFKETQLAKLKVGQRVTMTADRYGSDVEYHGVIEAIGAGTGSAFALIPAQNATGNWIKVAQRLPVIISLDRRELAEKPLRVGLSMEATVSVEEGSARP